MNNSANALRFNLTIRGLAGCVIASLTVRIVAFGIDVLTDIFFVIVVIVAVISLEILPVSYAISLWVDLKIDVSDTVIGVAVDPNL